MQIRPATPADHATYARLYERLAVDAPTLEADRFAREMMPTTWIAHDDAGPLAYLHFQMLAADCYVRQLVVDASAEGRGVGRALLQALRTHARAASKTHWRLNVKPDNVRALALYASVGMREVSRARVLRVEGWPHLHPIVDDDARARVTVRDLSPDEEVSIEREFALAAGQLEAARATPARQPLVALVDEERVGFALFDPAFPGAFPFRARDVVVTDAILQVCATRARGDGQMAAPDGRAHFQFVVDDDEALSNALLAKGASNVMETCQYRGALDDEPSPAASTTRIA